jgi:DNA invertase Pin-like site-specific DNA recombinase
VRIGAVARLKADGFNRTQIAKKLGINRVTVYRLAEEAATGAQA